MPTTENPSIQQQPEQHSFSKFPPLDTITSPTVATKPAAFYLNRAEQTLRVWACHENGPIRPLRVYGRLAWSVSDIKRVMGVA
ncbi:MAG TPA: hypothetical protein PLL01_01275 [Rhodoferax sp.]|nr:hypothetical protein [Rhodoferax sp.]HPW27997.1 hypothetical protein [Rhodoferax sp.]